MSESTAQNSPSNEAPKSVAGRCEVCESPYPDSTYQGHCKERSPFPGLCLGCFMGVTQLELFYTRATVSAESPGGRTVMGPWAQLWLKKILKDPRAIYAD